MSAKKLLLIGISIGVLAIVLFFPFDGNVEEEHHSENDFVQEYEIYPGDVVEKIEQDEDIVLLDVRTLEEYAEIHLKNALLLPVQELSQESLTNIGLGEDSKNKEIIIYCRSGARAKTAYDIMKSLGYTNIKSVAGGMIHWEEDEYPFTEIGTYETQDKKDLIEGETSGPKIEFDRTLHDFGVIPQYGGVVETTFEVRNDGAKILKVGDITTSCSCTSATISATEIKAEEKAVLTVRFDPDFHEEPLDVFKRTIFIPTNDTVNPEAEVTIQVDIEEGK